MMKGRKGISIPGRIELYKTLVRSHLEYAIPAWAFASSSVLAKLERTQAICLRKILGSHAHSSVEAVHIVANIQPMRFRIQELCAREYTRILEMPEDHPLNRALAASSGSGKLIL